MTTITNVDRLRFEDKADFDLWQEYVFARPDSHCADLGEWRLLWRELYGIENYSYVYREASRTMAALSLYHIRSPFMGQLLLTCPYFGYGGFYWETDVARDALLEQAHSLARQLGVDYMELRLRQALPAPYQVNTDFAEYRLELEETPIQTWQARLESNVRQNIRRSQKQNLQFNIATDYRPCYDLLRKTLREHGMPFHGRAFFELLNRYLGERVRYAEVRHEDNLLASGVIIRYKQTIITPYIGSLARSRSLRSNYLQYWGIIEDCPSEQVNCFDMGRSPRGSTHARFKQKWGCGELQAYYNYRLVNQRKRYRSVSRPSAVQRLATTIWKRLPLALTTALGPRLFRYVP